MVGARSNSRQVTPIGAEDWGTRLRNSVRRETATPALTPKRPARASTGGPKAGSGARSGVVSHAYGVGSTAVASRNISRHQRSAFTSAFQDELDDQEPAQPGLEPVDEDKSEAGNGLEYKNLPNRDESPAHSVNSYTETTLPTLPLIDKSFSRGREQGVSDPAQTRRKSYTRTLEHGISSSQHPTTSQRISRIIAPRWHGAKLLCKRYRCFLYTALLLLIFVLLLFYGISSGYARFPNRSDVSNDNAKLNDGTATITRTVVSYTQQVPDRALSSHINLLESRIAALESSHAQLQIESHARPQPFEVPFNHISDVMGATIITGITSPTKSRVPGILGLLTKLWTPPGARLPITALQAWSEPGDCWCTPAEKGALAVRAPYPMNAGALTIEHVLEKNLHSSGADLSTAPTSVDIWARSLALSPYTEQSETCENAPPQPKGWICLGKLEFDHRGQDARSLTMDLPVRSVVATDFVLLINRNGGNTEATCLYRVLLHGNRQT